MSREMRIVLSALVLLTFIGIGYLISQNMVEKTRTVRTPPGPEARANPLLAAERFFTRMGQRVESVRDRQLLYKLPPAGDTLLLYRVRPPANMEQLTALLEWVERGGTLVLDAAHLWDDNLDSARSALLDHLGARLIDTDDSGTELIELEFTSEPQPIAIRFNTRFRLIDEEDNADSSIWGDGGFYLLEYEYGTGLITLVNDLGLFSNKRIGDDDNAYFLHMLAATSQKLWLLYDPSSPSLISLAWRHARPLLISLMLLALFALWAANRRIGPLLPDIVLTRRDRKEHIEALGRFDLQHGLVPERLSALRKAVEHGWLLRHPTLEALDRRQRAEWIAAYTQRHGDEIFEALYPENDDTKLIRQIALLQRLRHWNQ